MFALGKLRITSEGNTWRMLSAERSTLIASASPLSRPAVTSMLCAWEASWSVSFALVTLPPLTTIPAVTGAKPT